MTFIPSDDNDWVQMAIDEIYSSFGDTVHLKNKSLLKFGGQVVVSATALPLNSWAHDFGPEVYPVSNTITHWSGGAADSGLSIGIEGHYISGSGGPIKFLTSTLTHPGTTKTALPRPMFRHTRGFNADSTDLDDDVYFYSDVAVDVSGIPVSGVHNVIVAEENQSLRGGTTFSDTDYFALTYGYLGGTGREAGAATGRLRIRQKGKVFRTQAIKGINENKDAELEYRPFAIVPPGSDVEILVEGSVAQPITVAGGFHGFLLLKE